MDSSANKILVMDDEESNRTLMEIILSQFGYEVDVVSDTDGAKELCRHHTYDLLILDLEIGNSKNAGIDLARYFKEKGQNIRAVVYSGGFTDDFVEKYRNLGFVGVIKKPFKYEALEKQIKSFLDPEYN